MVFTVSATHPFGNILSENSLFTLGIDVTGRLIAGNVPDDETVKERVGRWYTDDGLPLTFLGLCAKLGIEWGMFAATLAPFALVVGFFSSRFVFELSLTSGSIIPWYLSTVTAFTLGGWCYGTLDPED